MKLMWKRLFDQTIRSYFQHFQLIHWALAPLWRWFSKSECCWERMHVLYAMLHFYQHQNAWVWGTEDRSKTDVEGQLKTSPEQVRWYIPHQRSGILYWKKWETLERIYIAQDKFRLIYLKYALKVVKIQRDTQRCPFQRLLSWLRKYWY